MPGLIPEQCDLQTAAFHGFATGDGREQPAKRATERLWEMGFVLSLGLIAVGAVLRWAVTTEADGIDIGTVGLILLIIGMVGFVLAAIAWAGWWSWREWGRPAAPRRTVVRRRDEVVERRPPDV